MNSRSSTPQSGAAEQLSENESTSVDSVDLADQTNSSGQLAELSNNSINISIRFVNEKEMRVQAKPNDTILLLKK